MPFVEKDCFKCIHKGNCDGYIDRVAMNFHGCPFNKQFIPRYTKFAKSIKADKIKNREEYDQKHL
jgi:hypothetical protein